MYFVAKETLLEEKMLMRQVNMAPNVNSIHHKQCDTERAICFF